MTQYDTFDQGVEVRGSTILALEDALSRFSDRHRQRVRAALADCGIEDPDPDAWYPQDAELRVLETIAEELEPHILDRLGEQIPDAAEWTGDISSVEEGLRSINEAYHRNHRGGDIGHYRFTDRPGRTGEVECTNPYPCQFDRGLIRAVAHEHSPVESFVFVEERGDDCRRYGADTCTYTIHW